MIVTGFGRGPPRRAFLRPEKGEEQNIYFRCATKGIKFMDSTTTIKSVPAFTEEQLNILKAAFAHVGVRLVERAYDGMRGWQHDPGCQ